MFGLNDADKAKLVIREGERPPRQLIPADFDAIDPQRLPTWPQRVSRYWMLKRSPWLLLPLPIAAALWWWTGSLAVLVGSAGLVYDIIGVWLLAENLLLTDDEAQYYGTFRWIQRAPLIAMRDRRQTTATLWVVTLGFVLQLVSLVISAWPNR
jgi:hypothetical protein